MAVQFVKELQVIQGSSSNISPDDSEFFKIPVDLNKGSGGAFIYLCMKKGEGEDDAVTGLHVVSGARDIQAPPGYERIGVDLNKGAGGDFIYLCFTKNADVGSPVKEITVIEGGSASIPAPQGYTKIDADLNRGAGGAFIYFCYRT